MEEVRRTLLANMLAQRAVLEVLLTSLLIDRGEEFGAAVIGNLQDHQFPTVQSMSDEDAEVWADVVVRARQQIDEMTAQADEISRLAKSS